MLDVLSLLLGAGCVLWAQFVNLVLQSAAAHAASGALPEHTRDLAAVLGGIGQALGLFVSLAGLVHARSWRSDLSAVAPVAVPLHVTLGVAVCSVVMDEALAVPVMQALGDALAPGQPLDVCVQSGCGVVVFAAKAILAAAHAVYLHQGAALSCSRGWDWVLPPLIAAMWRFAAHGYAAHVAAHPVLLLDRAAEAAVFMALHYGAVSVLEAWLEPGAPPAELLPHMLARHADSPDVWRHVAAELSAMPPTADGEAPVARVGDEAFTAAQCYAEAARLDPSDAEVWLLLSRSVAPLPGPLPHGGEEYTEVRCVERALTEHRAPAAVGVFLAVSTLLLAVLNWPQAPDDTGPGLDELLPPAFAAAFFGVPFLAVIAVSSYGWRAARRKAVALASLPMTAAVLHSSIGAVAAVPVSQVTDALFYAAARALLLHGGGLDLRRYGKAEAQEEAMMHLARTMVVVLSAAATTALFAGWLHWHGVLHRSRGLCWLLPWAFPLVAVAAHHPEHATLDLLLSHCGMAAAKHGFLALLADHVLTGRYERGPPPTAGAAWRVLFQHLRSREDTATVAVGGRSYTKVQCLSNSVDL